jgi:hypothetical protein
MRSARLVTAAAAVAVAGTAAALWLRAGGERTHRDLLSQFEDCRQQPAPAAFAVRDVAIDGVTARAVVATGQTRLTCHVTVPPRAGLSVALALAPEVWTQPGDGVRLSIGVSDGRSFHDKHVVHLDPFARAGDRRWHGVTVDLREYEGLTIDLVFNTRAVATPDHDVAVWGAPRIVTR